MNICINHATCTMLYLAATIVVQSSHFTQIDKGLQPISHLEDQHNLLSSGSNPIPCNPNPNPYPNPNLNSNHT